MTYTQVVSRPYVYGGGEFCGSRVASADIVQYDVFVRAPEAECVALGRSFDTHSESRDPFPGRAGVLHCFQTDPYACERAMQLQQELAGHSATSNFRETGVLSADALGLFFITDEPLHVQVLFGFDPQRPLSLECARFTRPLDEDDTAAVIATACRDANHSWIVDVSWVES